MDRNVTVIKNRVRLTIPSLLAVDAYGTNLKAMFASANMILHEALFQDLSYVLGHNPSHDG